MPSHEGDIPSDEFEEIRLQIPDFENGRDSYALASAVASAFENNRAHLKRELFKNEFQIVIDQPDSEFSGKWQISLHRISCLSRRVFNKALSKIKQYIPFTQQFKKRKIAVIDVRHPKECLFQRGVSSTSKIAVLSLGEKKFAEPLLHSADPLPTQQTDIERMSHLSFQDPFTKLAIKALKTVEKAFVMESEHRGTHRFVLDDSSRLSLEADIVPDEDQKPYLEQNRKVVTAYRDFLISEFGLSFVEQIIVSYKIDFDLMIKEGLALYPDHVSKCNIGANNIEFRHIEELWDGLQKIPSLPFHSVLSVQEGKKVGDQSAAEFLSETLPGNSFPIRVLRGLLRSVPRQGTCATVQELQKYLATLLGEPRPQSIRELPPRSFNQIVDMIMPTDEERNKAYTGRRIRHLCVMGFHTMGDPNISNPCRDLFELMHVFNDCRKKEDWKNFFELLAHVVAKKSLFREDPNSPKKEESLHVGLLLPGPDSATGEKRWYFNESFFDDSQGNVNYVLLPACNGYTHDGAQALPMIKLYRSTASNRNAENWHDSIAADLNPHGSPGSLNPDLSFAYERKHFEDRTIPIWMGHLITALRTKLWKETANDLDETETKARSITYHDQIMQASLSCKIYLEKMHKDEPLDELEQFMDSENLDALEKAMVEYGHRFQEDPRYKIHQDIACVGHSLGGALSQAGTYLFTSHLKRMPVPGHQFICYSSDGPAIDNQQDSNFMKFGHTHRKLFEALNVQWRVFHQFEYGDIVPQAGGSHLGTTRFDFKKDKSWLDESVSVFRPLEGDALSILDPPTHGRRIGTATKGHDYALTKITPLDLATYDHSFVLRGKIRQIWGYRFLNSPRASEWIRKKTGLLLTPVTSLQNIIQGNGIGKRDENGVLALQYSRVLNCKKTPSPPIVHI